MQGEVQGFSVSPDIDINNVKRRERRERRERGERG